MKRRVVWAEATRLDLYGILRHLGGDNPIAAKRLFARIRSVGVALGEHSSGRPGRVAGTYEKVVPRSSYILVYAIRRSAAGAEYVAIARVIHTARDWPAGEFPPQD